ncbi:unnamed protein product [Peniophora sp. CBMAI 1063]|nr:unnamed protein product [Peniophora sp. CBMAI 1063]
MSTRNIAPEGTHKIGEVKDWTTKQDEQVAEQELHELDEVQKGKIALAVRQVYALAPNSYKQKSIRKQVKAILQKKPVTHGLLEDVFTKPEQYLSLTSARDVHIRRTINSHSSNMRVNIWKSIDKNENLMHWVMH